jgi:hypothetical protein
VTVSNNAFSRGLTFVEEGHFDTATTELTTVAANAGWDEVIASTDADADTVYIYCKYTSQGAGAAVEENLISVGVGGSGVEQAIIENIPLSGRVATTKTQDILWFPVQVPSGSRVSVKVDADTATNIGIGIKLFKGSEKSYAFSGAKAFGTTANYSGETVDPGGTANTKPATWKELVASSSDTIRGFWIHVGLNENLTIGAASTTFTDIGIGGVGAEQTIVLNHYSYVTTDEAGIQSVFYDIEIPSGTRISARSQCTDIDATDRIRTVALVGLI